MRLRTLTRQHRTATVKHERMGHVHADVELAAEKSAKVRMFVDTGATYSVIPDALARQIGVHRMSRAKTVTYADGRRARLDAGSAMFRVAGREAPSIVLIGKVAEPILGAETLEVLGLAVDPHRGKLKPTRSWTIRI
jgi:aspartyl protease family protein